MGSGAFGRVTKAFNKETGEVYACKKVPKQQKEGQPDLVEKEISILRALQDIPGVVKLKAARKTETHNFLIMELLKGGTLTKYMYKRGTPMSEPEAAVVMTQLLETLAKVHDLGITHRDIKCDNLVFANKKALELRVIDFGLATRVMKHGFATEKCGSLEYMAPELLHKYPFYTSLVDIWSAGVVCFALLTGKLPFRGPSINDIRQSIRHSDLYLRYDAMPSEMAAHFLECMLQRDLSFRWSAEQLLKHPWIVCRGRKAPKLNLFSAPFRSLPSPNTLLRSLPGRSMVLGDISSVHDSSDAAAAAAGTCCIVDNIENNDDSDSNSFEVPVEQVSDFVISVYRPQLTV